MAAFETEHYQLADEIEEFRGIHVLRIVAKQNYLVEITEGRRKLRSPKPRFESVMRAVQNVQERKPEIFELTLHPCYDVLCTGGPMGTTSLTEYSNIGVPPRLEEYADDQFDLLLQYYLVSRAELEELRSLERVMLAHNPQYRLVPTSSPLDYAKELKGLLQK